MSLLESSILFWSVYIAAWFAWKVLKSARARQLIKARFNYETNKLFKAQNKSRYHEMGGWRRP